MTLTELQTEVFAITNRPDLADRTLSAIRAATLKLHQMDFFSKDLFESGVAFAASSYLQQLEFRLLFPKWRALKYIRKSDINGADNMPFFDVVTPDSILDSYGLNKTDICYVAGETIQIKSSTELQYIFLGCYLNPDITLTGYSSWIAKDHPFAIVYAAAAQIFKSTGKDEEFNAYTLLEREQRQLVLTSNIQDKGY